MAKKKKSMFAGRVNRSAKKKQKNKGTYGYLQLPKGVTIFKEVAHKTFDFDIIPYIVTDEKHLDRDNERGDAQPGNPWFKRPFKIHRSVGSGDEMIVCPSTIGKRCPICEHQAKRFKEGAPKEETSAMRASLRNLYIIIPKNTKKYKEEYHIWNIADTNFQELLDEECENNEANEVFADLEGGKTISCRFGEGKVSKTKFPKASRIDFEERDKDYPMDVLEEVPDLNTILKIHPYKALEAMFFEIDEDDEDTDNRNFTEVDDTSSKKEPPRKKKTAEKKSHGKSKKKCPEGYKFGKDNEKHKECGDCDLWDVCSEEKERMKKAKG